MKLFAISIKNTHRIGCGAVLIDCLSNTAMSCCHFVTYKAGDISSTWGLIYTISSINQKSPLHSQATLFLYPSQAALFLYRQARDFACPT